jgi:CCR4-NOT complex subunit CAF16
VRKGELEFCQPVSELKAELAASPDQATKGWGQLFCAVQRMLLVLSPEFKSMITSHAGAAPAPPPPADAVPAVAISGLHWGYPGARGQALTGVDLTVARGSRCLLIGANGAGKTTLLKLIGGKNMVVNGSLKVLGREAFGDTKLNTMVSLLTGDWTRQVACVGSGVPFQADFSVGFMANSLADALIRDGMPEALVRARLARLSQLLDLDYEWRLHKVSDGQRRRAQLLLKLLRPSELLLLDEVTTDLDVLSRQALLQFLKEEAELRGATVIYSTHIFDGLDHWPTHLIRMRAGTVTHVGPAELTIAPAAAAAAGASGSLFQTVRGWLDAERQARPADAMDASGDASAQPLSASAAEPPKQAAPTSFASKYDRFGGAGRQSMFAR